MCRQKLNPAYEEVDRELLFVIDNGEAFGAVLPEQYFMLSGAKDQLAEGYESSFHIHHE